MEAMTPSYALLTAAHNEEAYIDGTLRAVVAQAHKPVKWVVVNDRSSDRTRAIVEEYAQRHKFIELIEVQEGKGRHFASKVHALRVGYQQLQGVAFACVGILDGDISFEPDYYCQLLQRIYRDPTLGLCGGFIYEQVSGVFQSRTTNTLASVAGATQLFRRECYEAIGGLQPIPYGGEDWVAEVMSRQQGWGVRSFPELKAFHHRPTGTAGGLLRYWFQQGRMDHSIGVLPSFEFVKCLRRMGAPPFIAGAMARLTAFALSYCMHAPRLMPQTFVDYLRNEQKARVKAMLHINSIPGLSGVRNFGK